MATNKAMRLGSVMLVLALLTTCAISATFAKYVTSATGNDSARVAYWGWTSDGNLAGDSTTLGLFAKTYAADDTSATSDNTVVSSDNVVAPGTKSSVDVTFKYTGYANTPSDAAAAINAPEVAYNFAVNAKATGIKGGSTTVDVDALDANPDFKWTLGKKGETATEYNTLKELIAAIGGLSGATTADTGSTDYNATYTKEYAAGALPAAFGTAAANTTYEIGWEWAFEDATKSSTQDTTDTTMGNATDLDDLKLEITITATQID